MFTWKPIYAEIAKIILDYRNRQAELLALLKELKTQGLKVGSLDDKNKAGSSTPLQVIDPFTFFATFNRGASDTDRCQILAFLKQRWKLQSNPPKDFYAIPRVDSRRSWFFPFSATRHEEDIGSLWSLASLVVHGQPKDLNPELFKRCLNISTVKIAKLTMGMFWLNPDNYLALDSQNRSYLESKGINTDVNDLPSYLRLLDDVNGMLGKDYVAISYAAWKHNQVSISQEQADELLSRFRQRYPDFTDFTTPGKGFASDELEYKRNALKRYQEELGNAAMSKLVAAGKGVEAVKELSKRVQANLVSFFGWRSSMGQEDKTCAAVLAEYLDVAAEPYVGPDTIRPIFEATEKQGLKVQWDTLSTTLWAMRPEDYLPIKISYYRSLAEELGMELPEGSPTPESFDRVLQFCRAFWPMLQPLKAKDWVDVQSFIWVVSQTNSRPCHYWAGGFAWGKESKLEDFKKNNYWQIGWSKSSTDPDAKQTWARFEQVQVGDLFAIKGLGGRYDLVIHYIGRVVEKEEDSGILQLEQQQVGKPLYQGKAPRGEGAGSWFDTLVPIKREDVIKTIFGEAPVVPPPPPPPPAAVAVRNLVLYGPPGTGKTYEVIERAVRLADPSFNSIDRKEINQRFRDLQKQGRIEFITFHQSYSYEDFVEGIRPVLNDTEEGNTTPRYECYTGIFKKIATAALFDSFEPAEGEQRVRSFDTVWKALISDIDNNPEATYNGLTSKSSYQLALTSQGNIDATNVKTGKTCQCSRKNLKKVYESLGSKQSINTTDVLNTVGMGCHSHLIAALFNELKSYEKDASTATVGAEEATVSDAEKAAIVQEHLNKPQNGTNLKPPHLRPGYVIVIDEINRGNISKILGELITLIEDDKRLPASNTIVGLLPYSRELFAVPGNLHILGTMNTADKSLALLDVALRRRFEFEELRIDFGICKALKPEMRIVLQELNRRITLRKDRDHRIGHAYFVNVADASDFNAAFEKKIIPLLQEYFYNDWEGLRFVLGEKDNGSAGFIRKLDGHQSRESRNKWQWYFDDGSHSLNCLETLMANYQGGVDVNKAD